jgi:hypothetical protein
VTWYYLAHQRGDRSAQEKARAKQRFVKQELDRSDFDSLSEDAKSAVRTFFPDLIRPQRKRTRQPDQRTRDEDADRHSLARAENGSHRRERASSVKHHRAHRDRSHTRSPHRDRSRTRSPHRCYSYH